jgi:2-oxoglutarate dehydrogenase E2 component (dihydrolipoamide succinyltransferase)
MANTVTMPQLGETVTEGTILSWIKQPGDSVAEDELLVEISTDKVDTEMPSPFAGVLQEILVPEGETVPVGTPLAVIADAAEAASESAAGSTVPPQVTAVTTTAPAPDAPAPDAPSPAATAAVAETAPPAVATPAATPAETPAPTTEAPRRGILSPVVRKLASEHGVDLTTLAGTGDGGRITRKDIEAAIAAGPTPPPPAAAPAATPPVTAPAPVTAEPAPVADAIRTGPGDEVVDLDRLRTRIAGHMIEAKRTAAHVWTSVEVDYEAVERVRKEHREAFKAAEGFSLTYLPFIAKATMDALAAYPVVNTSFFLDEGKQVFHKAVNLGIAVDLNQGGLVVVTARDADSLTLKGLARAIRAMALKARDGNLTPDDIAASSFTITNPGPFGSYMSAPIINLPNVAILSTDTVTKRPSVVTLPDGSDAIAIRHIGYLGLTWDHRAFDGSTAVLFLDRIKQNLETRDWEQELA